MAAALRKIQSETTRPARGSARGWIQWAASTPANAVPAEITSARLSLAEAMIAGLCALCPSRRTETYMITLTKALPIRTAAGQPQAKAGGSPRIPSIARLTTSNPASPIISAITALTIGSMRACPWGWLSSAGCWLRHNPQAMKSV
jgi:hypothetical protein